LTMNERAEPAGPGVLDRLRARYEPFDHFTRAFLHFRNCNGNLCAAGLTYHTLIALFPLLMVGFALGGFALSRHPELLGTLEERIRSWVSPELGVQVLRLMNSAVLGLLVFAYVTWVVVLYSTARAATASDNPRAQHIGAPVSAAWGKHFS
jgi:membrane protein